MAQAICTTALLYPSERRSVQGAREQALEQVIVELMHEVLLKVHRRHPPNRRSHPRHRRGSFTTRLPRRSSLIYWRCCRGSLPHLPHSKRGQR